MTKFLATMLLAALLGGCGENDATIASKNISQAADNFSVQRRIVFYDSLQGTYLLSIEGNCSLDISDKKLAVTCKVGDKAYKKHYLGLSDNVTYFAEHLKESDVGVYRYKVVFKPSAIIPDVDLKIGE